MKVCPLLAYTKDLFNNSTEYLKKCHKPLTKRFLLFSCFLIFFDLDTLFIIGQ